MAAARSSSAERGHRGIEARKPGFGAGQCAGCPGDPDSAHSPCPIHHGTPSCAHDLGARERDHGKSAPYGQIISGSPSHHDCLPRDRSCSQSARSRLSLATFSKQPWVGHGRGGPCTGPASCWHRVGHGAPVFFSRTIFAEQTEEEQGGETLPHAGLCRLRGRCGPDYAGCRVQQLIRRAAVRDTPAAQQVTAGWQGLNPGTGAPQTRRHAQHGGRQRCRLHGLRHRPTSPRTTR